MDLAEPTLDDVKDSGNAGNDCNICVAVYNPSKTSNVVLIEG